MSTSASTTFRLRSHATQSADDNWRGRGTFGLHRPNGGVMPIKSYWPSVAVISWLTRLAYCDPAKSLFCLTVEFLFCFYYWGGVETLKQTWCCVLRFLSGEPAKWLFGLTFDFFLSCVLLGVGVGPGQGYSGGGLILCHWTFLMSRMATCRKHLRDSLPTVMSIFDFTQPGKKVAALSVWQLKLVLRFSLQVFYVSEYFTELTAGS